ncbi:MAG: cell division protein FtsQ/DivIB [Xanthobacteraceae bacterium]|nr:cell division protein FtsQ/DivIB [Xanthobacteraceae bacterium]
MRSRLNAGEEIGSPFDAPRRWRVLDRLLWPTGHRRRIRRWGSRVARVPPPGLGIAGSILLLAATLGYGAIAGGHVADVVAWLKDARDEAANAAGFRIAAVSLTGPKEVSREEVLTTAGVTGRASLLFLDADAARARLMANPWIADAAVLKLYPDRLQITITERQAFALWQENGRVSVIAADGTVLEPFVEDRYLGLPLVVGRGAERQAKDFLAVIDRYPDIRGVLRASVLIAQRRWNLRLNNGIDVRLPEGDVALALECLVMLDREKKLLSRDIVAVDLRLPDRVSVRLSDAAAAARDDALKDKKKKRAGDA